MIIELKNVSFKYTGETENAVSDVSLSINEGDFITILGRNGSGKSTLARLFNALLIPDKGEVIVGGIKTSDKARLFDVRKKVGVVFQNPDNQLVSSIVEDDVAFGPENLGLPRKEIKERIDFALNAVGMEEFRHSSPERLSGGQKQRIAIAGVLAIKPSVLVLDESTAMLDPKGRDEVIKIAEKLNKEQGITVINITHYMDEALSSDKIIVLDGGKVVAEDTPKGLFKREDFLRSHGLELPVSAILSKELKKAGIDLGEDILSEKDLGERLCRYLSRT